MWKPKYFQEITKNSVSSTVSGSASQVCPARAEPARGSGWPGRRLGESTMVNSTPVITSDSTYGAKNSSRYSAAAAQLLVEQHAPGRARPAAGPAPTAATRTRPRLRSPRNTSSPSRRGEVVQPDEVGRQPAEAVPLEQAGVDGEQRSAAAPGTANSTSAGSRNGSDRQPSRRRAAAPASAGSASGSAPARCADARAAGARRRQLRLFAVLVMACATCCGRRAAGDAARRRCR